MKIVPDESQQFAGYIKSVFIIQLKRTLPIFFCFWGCHQTLSLEPINGLALEYQAEVHLLSSTCSNDDIQSVKITNTRFLLGSRDEQMVISISLAGHELLFDALLCSAEAEMDLSFCMNLNQTDQLPTLLTRAPTLSHPEDGVITCEFQYSSPEDLLSIETIETISLSQKTELEACCLGDPHAKASRFHRTEDGWSGRFSLREASSLKLPENGRPSMLSSFEESGLLALCGGEVSCVSHFEIAAKSQK